MATTVYQNEALIDYITVYVENDETLYNMMDHCADSMVKIHKRNKPLTLEHLAGTSTVSKILTGAIKILRKYDDDHIVITRDQMCLLKKEVAKMIWDLFTEKIN